MCADFHMYLFSINIFPPDRDKPIKWKEKKEKEFIIEISLRWGFINNELMHVQFIVPSTIPNLCLPLHSPEMLQEQRAWIFIEVHGDFHGWFRYKLDREDERELSIWTLNSFPRYFLTIHCHNTPHRIASITRKSENIVINMPFASNYFYCRWEIHHKTSYHYLAFNSIFFSFPFRRGFKTTRITPTRCRLQF